MFVAIPVLGKISCPHSTVITWSEKFKNGVFTPKAHQIFLRPFYAEEICQHNNHCSFRICVRGRLSQGNHMIVVTSSFLELSSGFRMFSVDPH